MALTFRKMHANGDHFAIVDARGAGNPITQDIARRLGDPYRGIGFNQLAVILDCDEADARLLFWNPDGTTLDACGSATRGVADILMEETGKWSCSLRSNRGVLLCERLPSGLISVDMGRPSLDWRDIPLAKDVSTLSLPLPGEPTACSMGNPHCTFFVDDLTTTDVQTLGPAIEVHPLFPEKTNVHFVQVLDRRRIRLRIWERGGGIPLGSGSCSCGAVVGGIRRGLLDSIVDVACDGGHVQVTWDGAGGVHLAGPVQQVYVGSLSRQMLDS